MARTLVSYKLPKALHLELRRVSREAGRDMTGIVEDALHEWLLAHRWLPADHAGTLLGPTERRARTAAIDRLAKRSRRYRERAPGHSHDDVLYGGSV